VGIAKGKTKMKKKSFKQKKKKRTGLTPPTIEIDMIFVKY